MTEPKPVVLAPIEARVLGVLVEKQHVTPDVYPMTVNALTAGCNQKTSRNPVMELREADVQATLDELRPRLLVIETYGASGRVKRYAHNLGKVLAIPEPSLALLAMLMLRGAQTSAELRAHCDRLHRFADVSSVDAYLEEMAGRPAGALAVKLPRQPGERESRWVHLMCGEEMIAAAQAQALPAAADAGEIGLLREEVAQLREEVAHLRAQVQQLQQSASRADAYLAVQDANSQAP